MDQFLKATLIFCDGACSGNPGPGGWGAIVATPEGKVWELGAHNPQTTNNQMELTGAICALEFVKMLPGEVCVHTDSTYVIHGITKWIFGWKRRDWKSAEGKDVANRDLWEKLLAVVAARGKLGKVSWRYVRGHVGIPGNDRVDEIAVEFSKRRRPFLYEGPLIGYGIAIHDLPEDSGEAPPMKPKSQAKAAAYSYVSLVGGIAFRHSTWVECERRVKGQSGAKFKKATSAEDEAEILKSWGVSDVKSR